VSDRGWVQHGDGRREVDTSSGFEREQSHSRLEEKRQRQKARRASGDRESKGTGNTSLDREGSAKQTVLSPRVFSEMKEQLDFQVCTSIRVK